jgi:hypothetical protein
MEPSAENSAAATEHAVVCPRKPNDEPGYAAREGRSVVRLDNQMGVVVLHAEMHDAEPRPGRPTECSVQFTEATLFTHAGQKAPAAQSHMNWMAAMMDGALRVRDVSSGRGVSPFSRNAERKAKLLGPSRHRHCRQRICNSSIPALQSIMVSKASQSAPRATGCIPFKRCSRAPPDARLRRVDIELIAVGGFVTPARRAFRSRLEVDSGEPWG